MADKKQPWDFGANSREGYNETAKGYKCFRVYLELGNERNVKTVADVTGVKLDTVKAYAHRNNWSERSAEYDSHLVQKWAKEARAEFESTHKRELMKFRKDQQVRAEKLGRVADLLIDVTTETLEEMVASGEPVDRQQLASIASTAAKLSDAAMNTAAAALGVDDLLEAIAPEFDG